MLHSFSVLDIQKMRNNLKSSKSYPHDLKEKVSEEEEEDVEKEKEQKEAPPVTASKVVKPAAVFASKATEEKTTVTTAPQSQPPVTAETRKPESQLINVRRIYCILWFIKKRE